MLPNVGLEAAPRLPPNPGARAVATIPTTGIPSVIPGALKKNENPPGPGYSGAGPAPAARKLVINQSINHRFTDRFFFFSAGAAIPPKPNPKNGISGPITRE